MNRDRLEGNWKQLRGKIKEQWGKLTHDPQCEADGMRIKCAGGIQKRHGYAKEQAARQLKAFLHRNRNWAH